MNEKSKSLNAMRWHTAAHAFARIGVIAAIAFPNLVGSPWAADWSIRSTISERIEFDDNLGVAVDSPGNVFGSITTLATTIAAEAKTYSIVLDTDLSYQEYEGPGETRGLDAFSPSFSLGLAKQTKRTDYTLDLSYSQSDTATTEFDDTGLTNIDATRLSYSARTSAMHRVNRSNTVTLTANVEQVDYSPSSTALPPSLFAETSLAWTRLINRRTDATLSGSIGYYSADDSEDTTNWILKANVDAVRRLTNRLTVTGGIGLNLVESETTAGSDSTIGYSGRFGLDYKRKRTTVTFDLAQALEPSSSGELQNRTTADLAIQHQINRHSSFGVNASLGTQASIGDGTTSRKTATISPVYTYIPARNWRTNVGYTFRYSEAEDTAQSHKVFLSVSRTFVALP